MTGPICRPKCDEEQPDEFVLPDLRDDYVNEFQACRWFHLSRGGYLDRPRQDLQLWPRH